MKKFATSIVLTVLRAVLDLEKWIFWHTGRKMPMLRKFHAYQSALRQKELNIEKLMAL